MTKTAQLLTLVFLGVCSAVFFVPVAYAQSGPLVILGQGYVNATSSDQSPPGVATYSIYVGQGFVGSSTSAVVSVKHTSTTGVDLRVDIDSYSDSAYQNSVGTCTWDNTGGNTGTADGFVQLTHLFQQISGGCTLNPANYLKISLTYSSVGTRIPYIYGGTSSFHNYPNCTSANSFPDCHDSHVSSFFPYFNVLGGSWSLLGTTTSSGVFFSGAVDLCNNAFASTTGIGATIGNGICIAAGFLFVPNSDSVQAFFGIPQSLGNTFPFSWLVQIKNILAGATASSSENFISIHTSVGTSTSSFYIADAELISTSSLATFFPDSVRLPLKTTLAVGFYLLAAGFLYRKLNNVWQTT